MEEPGGPRPTTEELQSLTVVKLRQRLAQYGIPQSGNKAALVERLNKFYTDRDAKAQAQHQPSFPNQPQEHYGEIQEDLHLQQQQQLQIQLQQQQEQQRLQLQQQQMAVEQAALLDRQRQEDAWRQQQLAAAQAAEHQRLQEEHARAIAAERERLQQEEAIRRQQLAEQAAAAERERQIFEQQERQRLEEEAIRQQQLAVQAAAVQARQLRLQREEEERRRLEEEAIREQRLAVEAAERQRKVELQKQEKQKQEKIIRQHQMEMQEAAAERQKLEQLEVERQEQLQEESMRTEAERRLEEEERQRQYETQRLKEEARQNHLDEQTRQKELEAEARLTRLQEEIGQKEFEPQTQLEIQAMQLKQGEASNQQQKDDASVPEVLENVEESGGAEGGQNQENGASRKQPLFKASIGGMRARISQLQPIIASNNDAEDLDGQSTPAGPMPKSKGGPVPLMSLEIKPPPVPILSTTEVTRSNKDDVSHFPKVLEQALALKGERANAMGVHPEDIAQVDSEPTDTDAEETKEANQGVLFEDPEIENMKENKGKQRQKHKKKKKKKNRPQEWARQAEEVERKRKEDEERQVKKAIYGEQVDVEVEYIQDKLDIEMSDPMYRTFAKIFEVFKIAENEEEIKTENKNVDQDKEELEDKTEDMKKVPHMLEEDDLVEEDEADENKDKLSKRKLKKLNRLSVAELKQLVSRPDVVEMHDVTAKDPNLLVSLKSTRNSVAVPRHWCFKRKYLQGKRGIEKAAFDLPDFIKKTGIMEMRAALQEKEVEKNMKSKMREKVRPKLGKIDIDYQKLHDAFFKWQTKPRMTHHGDLYYEGKEFEIRLKEKKPGDLSDDLRTALGMPVGPNAHKVPPPWLIAMQRYGPPPSYPNLKIPGLNAAIPDGCSFGYHAGGWGKPPVDETGKPLYGDVFGTADAAYAQQMTPEEIDTTLWGEMESESEEEESSDEDEDEEDEQAEDERVAGAQTPLVGEGLATPSGMSSVGIGGLGQETPELLELRKKKIEAEMEGGETPNLYTVLPERRNERIGASMMGSTHTYDLGQAGVAGARQAQVAVGGAMTGGGTGTGGVEMALNPEEVDLMDTEAMAAKAEAALRDQQANLAKEDLSDMVAEHAAKAANKRKRLANKDDGKSAKKYKEFKF